jgi:amidase
MPYSRIPLTALASLALFAGIAAFQPRQTPAEVKLPQQRHEFTPTVFHNKFAATSTPVLRVSPGDSIRTTTIDATGTDERGVHRAKAGNPQTGPFSINGAQRGGTVAVHLSRLRLNRDWAISMPLKPMLGCIALAPPVTDPVAHTGEFGVWGGNLDFNEIVEGTIVFLPVNVPGGLLYLGDAHAAQGDGELNGNGLETSMDVEIRVDLLPRYPIPAPLKSAGLP